MHEKKKWDPSDPGRGGRVYLEDGQRAILAVTGANHNFQVRLRIVLELHGKSGRISVAIQY